MPVIMEGITLSDYTVAIIEYLQRCYDSMEAGEAIPGDPFFKRDLGKPDFSDADVERVVAAIDAEFHHEITTYAGYHKNRSGADHDTEFSRLSLQDKRAMVEGLDYIAREFPPPPPPAPPTYNYHDEGYC